MSQAKCYFALPLEIAAGTACAPHDHSCAEFVLQIGSAGILHEGEETYEYEDGDIFIHQSGINHWVENTESGFHLCVGVNGGDAETLPVGVYRSNAVIRDIYKMIQDEIAQDREGQLEILDYLAGMLIIQLKRLIGPALRKPMVSSHVIKAKRIMDTRFDESINLSEMASSLYISADYLRQVFKEAYGESPLHYLIKRRVEFACEMLKMTEKPIQEIANASGIGNPYYFSRIFKKIKGLSPTEFRIGHKAKKT